MLKEIKISNFAIIENLRVEFHPGLNVLTGETGAGKSILMNALNLILGGRADTDFIRSGESTATVEAVFETTDSALLGEIHSLGIDPGEGELLIKRNVSHAGKSRCFLNDSSVTVATLAKIGNRLVDIHGQHDHQALLRTETHVDLLDRYGKTLKTRQDFGQEFLEYQNCQKNLEAMRSKEMNRKERLELLQFQLTEIEQAQLSPEEEDELKYEKNKLRHAEKLHQSLESTLNRLTETDGSALEQVGRAQKEIESLLDIDPGLEKQAERAQTAYCELEELSDELRNYLGSIEFNPPRLEEIDDRLAEINGLKRKYGMAIEAILEERGKIAAELDSLSSNQEKMDDLKKEISVREKSLAEQAIALAEKREKTAKNLKKNVEKELRDLNMAQVQLGVRFDYPEAPEGFVRFRGEPVKLYPTGIGTVELLFSPNPGEELRPLAKIASGGELSRVMLAIKSILHEQDPVPVMVFDEVDTGIGGQVAEKVGLKLAKVAEGKQVFCITHLPQIAGMASAHYLVQKTVKDNRTHSTIGELNYDNRVAEIARMSGGERITQATLKFAKEMIKK
ncbi:MAG: DNA repair protein RecN [Nitrospinaceae bacterium]|nr:MAG: DNA repair protein RecN [Nitrospinaceae bacterium]